MLANVAAAGPTPEQAAAQRPAAARHSARDSRAVAEAARRAAARADRRVQLRRDRRDAGRAGRHHQVARLRSAARGADERLRAQDTAMSDERRDLASTARSTRSPRQMTAGAAGRAAFRAARRRADRRGRRAAPQRGAPRSCSLSPRCSGRSRDRGDLRSAGLSAPRRASNLHRHVRGRANSTARGIGASGRVCCTRRGTRVRTATRSYVERNSRARRTPHRQ